ncbi:MAG: ATP-binding protein, partial [Candidatus Binatia bacterium]
MPRRKARKSDTIVGRLRAADPFELIRWLARSQPDPRKALAELVQNSIDAGAKHIHVTRSRERGVTTLRIADDGEGVIPELERTEALTYVATHIGHSRKRNLTPEQRRELMLQGKYGIGLLGFWAIGAVLEIRTYLRGQTPFLLRMFEDAPKFEIERIRGR